MCEQKLHDALAGKRIFQNDGLLSGGEVEQAQMPVLIPRSEYRPVLRQGQYLILTGPQVVHLRPLVFLCAVHSVLPICDNTVLAADDRISAGIDIAAEVFWRAIAGSDSAFGRVFFEQDLLRDRR